MSRHEVILREPCIRQSCIACACPTPLYALSGACLQLLFQRHVTVRVWLVGCKPVCSYLFREEVQGDKKNSKPKKTFDSVQKKKRRLIELCFPTQSNISPLYCSMGPSALQRLLVILVKQVIFVVYASAGSPLIYS
jgi:hypothetical protein